MNELSSKNEISSKIIIYPILTSSNFNLIHQPLLRQLLVFYLCYRLHTIDSHNMLATLSNQY